MHGVDQALEKELDEVHEQLKAAKAWVYWRIFLVGMGTLMNR